MTGVTPRQQELLTYITDFITTHKYSPSYREIMAHFNLNSIGTIAKFVQVLKSKGLLVSDKGKKRSLMPTKSLTSTETITEHALPFIGKLSVGFPIVMFTRSKTISVPSNILHAPDVTYVLQVEGDSLNDEQIAHGDYLIVEARQEAQTGETIVALINSQEAIIKRYYPENAYVKFVGNNPQQQPLIFHEEEINIQGVLIGVLRFYV
jgi:repressor LexA